MPEKLNFEESMQKLEEIAEKLEQGNINLDESVELYAQASKLVVACAAQLKLEKLEPKPMEEKQEQKEEQDV